MSCEHLICAQCAGPVAEGRCPACRMPGPKCITTRHGPSVQLIVVVLLVLALLTLAGTHLGH